MDGRIAAEAWVAWRDSETGRKCVTTPVGEEYLRNRLWWAFMAGYEAAAKARPTELVPPALASQDGKK